MNALVNKSQVVFSLRIHFKWNDWMGPVKYKFGCQSVNIFGNYLKLLCKMFIVLFQKRKSWSFFLYIFIQNIVLSVLINISYLFYIKTTTVNFI